MAKVTPAEPSVDELREQGLARKRKAGLSLEQIADLQATYREVALAEDDDAKAIRRAILAKLRRVTHEELHPHCKRVIVTIPQHPSGTFYSINEKPYVGRVEVYECVARTLLWQVQVAQQVERDRMKESGRVIDLDNPVAERIRAIQEA